MNASPRKIPMVMQIHRMAFPKLLWERAAEATLFSALRRLTVSSVMRTPTGFSNSHFLPETTVGSSFPKQAGPFAILVQEHVTRLPQLHSKIYFRVEQAPPLLEASTNF